MRRAFSVLLILIAFAFTSCESNEPRTRTELRMDTICSITVYTAEDEALLDGAFDIIDETAKIIDMYDPESEISYVNANAASHPVNVSDELFSLLSYAYGVSEASSGAFNIAVGPLVTLWGIGGENARRPSDEEIESTLFLLDWHDIVLDKDDKSVAFLTEGMKIDLGAVGKGYVADKIAAYLRKNGTESAIINLGGNVYMIGARPDGKDWTVGLQDPNSAHGGYYTTVVCRDTSVVTSGGYERLFTDTDGTVYHHILDSSTGFPAVSDLISTSIITPDSTLADMLSTATFVLGSEKAVDLVNSYGVKAVFLTLSGEEIRVGI